MMRWFALAFVVGLAGCSGSNNNTPPPPPPPSFSPWNILYSPGMPASMSVDGSSYFFDFPAAPGSVHYIIHSDMGGRSSIRMRFQITGDGQLVPTEGSSSAKVRLYLQRRGDNLSGAGEYEHYRFWSAPTDLAAGDFTMEVNLDPALWTSVFGQHSAEGFAATLADLENVGFTFGGEFAGHGVYVNGSARFTLLSYEMF